MGLIKFGEIGWSATKLLSDWLIIPKSNVLKGVNLYLSVIGNTHASNTPVPDPEAPAGLIKLIELRVGSETPIMVDAESLAAFNYWDRKCPPVRSMIVTTNQTGVELGHIDIEIPFEALGMTMRELSQLIPGDREIALRVMWGISADLGTNYTITSAILSVAGQIEQHMAVEDPLEKSIRTKETVVAASQDALEIDLPESGMYQSILIKEELDGVPGSIIQKISLRSGTGKYLYQNIDAAQFKCESQNQAEITSQPNGYFMIDFPSFRGDWIKLLNAALCSDLKLELKVVYTGGKTNIIKVTYRTFDRYPEFI